MIFRGSNSMMYCIILGLMLENIYDYNDDCLSSQILYLF